MSPRKEEGYILASALTVLLAISLVAAALVSTSADALRRVKGAEREASADAVLRSAVLIVSSQLAQDPRRRKLQFEGPETIDVFGKTVKAEASFESLKLDINLASPEAIEARLLDAGIAQDTRSGIRAAIQEHRSSKEPVRLLDDIAPAGADRDCLYSILTAFGGRTDYKPEEQTHGIGRPAAGARLYLEVWTADEPARGLAATVIMTGDPAAPTKVLDWRHIRTKGEERCNETQ